MQAHGVRGTWGSGITAARHAEGPELKAQCVQPSAAAGSRAGRGTWAARGPPPASIHHGFARGVHQLLGLEDLCRRTFCGAHGVVVSHPLRMWKALGSNPSVSRLLQQRAQLGGMWHMGSGQARPSFLPAMDMSEDPPTNCGLHKTCGWGKFCGAHGVVVSHPLRMRKALGSIPSVSICVCP